jgi:SEC-C motif domain protein
MKCPCHSALNFDECCEPYLSGRALPDTAEKLMRSRYTAYTRADIPYIQRTLAPENHADFDAVGALAWATSSRWKGLQIISKQKGGPEDTQGVVEFIASFEDQSGTRFEHHEISKFRKDQNGQWLFVLDK